MIRFIILVSGFLLSTLGFANTQLPQIGVYYGSTKELGDDCSLEIKKVNDRLIALSDYDDGEVPLYVRMNSEIPFSFQAFNYDNESFKIYLIVNEWGKVTNYRLDNNGQLLIKCDISLD